MQGIIAAVGLLGILIFAAVVLVVFIFYLLTLQRALNRCSPESLAMKPGLVWLTLIPCFNIVWQFFVVINVAKSLGAEFKKRGIPAEELPGQGVGLAMCILNVVSAIPYLGCLTAPAGLVCWIIYWVKIAGYSQKLAT
jgi:heme/copper-type cytochrome/quinol oxidase subunit 2